MKAALTVGFRRVAERQRSNVACNPLLGARLESLDSTLSPNERTVKSSGRNPSQEGLPSENGTYASTDSHATSNAD